MLTRMTSVGAIVAAAVAALFPAPGKASDNVERISINLPFDGKLSAQRRVATLGIGRPDKIVWIFKEDKPFTSDEGYCFTTGTLAGPTSPVPTFLISTDRDTKQWYVVVSGGALDSQIVFRCALF